MKKQVAKAKLLKKPSASSSALAVFKKTCKKCGHEFTGRAKKNVSYSLRRHMREDHGIGKGVLQSKQERLEVQRKYKSSAFRVEPVLAGVSKCSIYVVCPEQREKTEHMFSDTRKHFCEIGFNKSSVRRMYGVDPNRVRRGWSPDDLKPHRFLGKYFICDFYPVALAAFNEGVEVIFWAEDDCRVNSGVSAADLVRVVRAAAPAASWLGFYGKPPKWGAHLVGFTKASLENFMPTFKEKHEDSNMAIDTIFATMAAEKGGLIKTPREALAKQKKHALKGRKLSRVKS